jgi:DNA-binding MarR family transcriptional regulator
MAPMSVPRLLLDALRSVEAQFGPALEDRGASELTPSQARALLHVDRTGTRLTELARRAGVTKQAMMQLVDDLQGLGCVRRTPDPQDGRAKVVRLTAKGLRQRARARKALQMVEGRIRRRLGPRKYAALRGILEELGEEEEEEEE